MTDELTQAVGRELEQEPEPETPEPSPEPEAPPAPDEAPEQDPRVEQALGLYRYLEERPDLARAMVEFDAGRAVPAPPPEPEPQQESSFDFWTDPEQAVKGLYDRVEQQQQFIQERQVQDQTAAINTGFAVFAQSHPDLPQEEVDRLGARLAQEGLLPVYWQRSPNFTGVSQAMEAIYRQDYFDRSRDVVAKDLAKSTQQKRRAAAVGTGSASAPRSEPVPENPQERRQAMIKDLEEHMNS